MRRSRAYIAAVITALSMLGVLAAMRATAAQESEITIRTNSGFIVEHVNQRGACVVIVSSAERTGSANRNFLAAVPCR